MLHNVSDIKLAVVAHDAGSARHLFSWLRLLDIKPKFCIRGPASSLMHKFFPDSYNYPDLRSCLSECNILLSGTSWASDHEHCARRIALSLGLINIACLDHWVNYRERFHFGDTYLYPDIAWVADPEAADIARKKLPYTIVQQLPNIFLALK